MQFSQKLDYMPARELEKQRASPPTGQTGSIAKAPSPEDMNMILVDTYRRSSAEKSMPEELSRFANTRNLRDMQRRESFGTVPTASDPFFIGHALGKLSTVRGEVGRMLPDGLETTSGQKIQASVVIKNFGFEDPDTWLKDVVGQTHMHSPLIINERIWLSKAERSRLSIEEARKIGRDAFGDFLNIPPVAPAIAATFVELFCFFQQRPDKLRELIQSGQLPEVEIGRETGLSWSRGQWAMMQCDPMLAARCNSCRHKISEDMKKRWTFSEYFQENRAFWKESCKRITGDENCVPYLWENLEPLLGLLDQQEARQESKL